MKKKARFLAALAAGILACSSPLQASANGHYDGNWETAPSEWDTMVQQMKRVTVEYLGTDECQFLEYEDSHQLFFISPRGCGLFWGYMNDDKNIAAMVRLPAWGLQYCLFPTTDVTAEDFAALDHMLLVEEKEYTKDGEMFHQFIPGKEGEEGEVYYKDAIEENPINLLAYETHLALQKMIDDGILKRMTALAGMNENAGAGMTFSLNAGDLNDDVQTDVKDAVLLSRVVAEDPELTLSAAGRINADLDDDGAYTVDDLTLLLAKLSGK